MSGHGGNTRTVLPAGWARVECPECGMSIAVVTSSEAIWAALRNHTCRTAPQPREEPTMSTPALHAVPSGKRPHPRELVNHPDAKIRRAAQKVVDAVAVLDEVWADNAERAELLAPALLDKTAAAAYLGTTERHLQRLWAERRIPAVKIGRKVRFRLTDLDRWIAAHTVEAVDQ